MPTISCPASVIGRIESDMSRRHDELLSVRLNDKGRHELAEAVTAVFTSPEQDGAARLVISGFLAVGLITCGMYEDFCAAADTDVDVDMIDPDEARTDDVLFWYRWERTVAAR